MTCLLFNCRFDGALEEAADVDHLLDTNLDAPEISVEKKPFLGVPFSSKESIQVKGQKVPSAILFGDPRFLFRLLGAKCARWRIASS